MPSRRDHGTGPEFCDLPHHGGAQFPIDVEAGYEIIDGLELMVGAQNVFNSYPDKLDPAIAGVAGSKYPSVAPAGFAGGYYYFRLRGNF